MVENLHLLANPNYHQKKIIQQRSIDDNIYMLLTKKYKNIKITREDYDKIILKIENLFMENYNQKIIASVIEDIVNKTIHEQVLF